MNKKSFSKKIKENADSIAEMLYNNNVGVVVDIYIAKDEDLYSFYPYEEIYGNTNYLMIIKKKKEKHYSIAATKADILCNAENIAKECIKIFEREFI